MRRLSKLIELLQTELLLVDTDEGGEGLLDLARFEPTAPVGDLEQRASVGQRRAQADASPDAVYFTAAATASFSNTRVEVTRFAAARAASWIAGGGEASSWPVKCLSQPWLRERRPRRTERELRRGVADPRQLFDKP